MRVVNIKIQKPPFVILVTQFDNEPDVLYHYHLESVKSKNRYNDIGCWHIKYKVAALN
jgi:hypothetical protein